MKILYEHLPEKESHALPLENKLFSLLKGNWTKRSAVFKKTNLNTDQSCKEQFAIIHYSSTILEKMKIKWNACHSVICQDQHTIARLKLIILQKQFYFK
jgi:hypothetical protein